MVIKPIKEIIVGSSAFFGGMKDFQSKDVDKLCIMNAFPFSDKTNVFHTQNDKDDYILYRNMGKEGYIKDALDSKESLRLGKFLVPEFIEYVGLKINDLKRLAPLVDKLDGTHGYERIIFQSYIENGQFELTPKQRKLAYAEYKKYR